MRKLIAIGVICFILFFSVLVYLGIENISDGSELNAPRVDLPIITTETTVPSKQFDEIIEGLAYYTATDVAKYLYQYKSLPPNYLNKETAREKGWNSEKGNLWDVTDKGVIGGDRFSNREGLLPDAANRVWYECDVNYKGGFRNAMRLVYSNDGLIYYTDDHYASFKRLYD